MKYSFSKSVTMHEVKARINEIFQMATICGYSNLIICEQLNDKIYTPLGERYSNGRRKHSVWLSGYAQGIIDSWRDRLYFEYLEFCYVVNGELLSTHKTSKRRTTREFENYQVLSNCESSHYYKHVDKVF